MHMYSDVLCVHIVVERRRRRRRRGNGEGSSRKAKGTYRRPIPAVPKRDDQTTRLYATVEENGRVYCWTVNERIQIRPREGRLTYAIVRVRGEMEKGV